MDSNVKDHSDFVLKAWSHGSSCKPRFAMGSILQTDQESKGVDPDLKDPDGRAARICLQDFRLLYSESELWQYVH